MGTEHQDQNVITPPPSRTTSSAAVLRWRLLRKALLTSEKNLPGDEELSKVSRRPVGRYNLVHSRIISPGECGVILKGSNETEDQDVQDVVVEYSFPAPSSVKLMVRQRCNGITKLTDLVTCRKNAIDNTGICCLWPAEEVLTYFCARHPEIFRNKTVVELGSGYGLGGLAIGAWTEAAEVVITDGNPLVIDYVEQNITANCQAFGNTRVSSSLLYWSRDEIPLSCQTFDLVVAADCTFFKDFHIDLAYTIRCLLGTSEDSRAILFNPRRGDTLDLFVNAAENLGLLVEITMQYDAQVWHIHQELLQSNQMGWPNYDDNHSYPLYISVTSGMSQL